MKKRAIIRQAGYTLIELLLYVSIVGSLLIAVTYFFSTAAESRIKNQSIAEVNDQGVAIMDNILQNVRNATSITAPATGASGQSLTLVVPTAPLSPTIYSLSGTPIGYTADGLITDSSNRNTMKLTKFVASTTGTISSLYGHLSATIGASPNNQGQMAIYSGTATAPTALLANSASVTLAPSTWNIFPIPTVTVTSGQTYWIGYNTNGSVVGENNLRYHAGAVGQSLYKVQTFGTWPASWTGTTQDYEFSVYAMIDSTVGTSSVMGYNVDGGQTDSSDSNNMNATKFVASTSGTASVLHAFLGPLVGAAPNDKGQMAIYSGTSSPTTLLATSASVSLTASAWNNFPISGVGITSGQTYWLVYNANGTAINQSDLRYHTGTTGQSMYLAQTFGTFQASWTGTAQNVEFSMYTDVVGAAAATGTINIKEGAGSAVPLTNDKVRLTGLNIRNLTKTGTGGLVQVTFTLTRVNPENRNEYDYQKTFTSSAEVSW
jgi:Tfp pilus assembly protein PilE